MIVEIREHNDYRAIFVDGHLFDWEMDLEGLKKAASFTAGNPTLQKSIEGDIQRHFVESFSEFIGRPITLIEIVEAINKGIL